VIRSAIRWVDDRLGASHFTKTALNKIFPDHWSFMLGEVAMYSLVILILTGVYLTFFFVPAAKDVVYAGPYEPLQGVHMSAAYASTLHISFEVRAGWSCARCTTGPPSSSSPPSSCTCAGCSSPAPSAGPASSTG